MRVPSGLRYIYYQIYGEDGAIPCKRPVNSNDPYLARIKANQVKPPHTVSSLKRCILKAEDLPSWVDINLFADISSQSPMTEGRISLLTRDGFGFMPEEPIVLIIFGRFLTFNKKLEVVVEPGAQLIPGLLSVTRGDILYTDGIVMMLSCLPCFAAIDERGSEGGIRTDCVKIW